MLLTLRSPLYSSYKIQFSAASDPVMHMYKGMHQTEGSHCMSSRTENTALWIGCTIMYHHIRNSTFLSVVSQ